VYNSIYVFFFYLSLYVAWNSKVPNKIWFSENVKYEILIAGHLCLFKIMRGWICIQSQIIYLHWLYGKDEYGYMFYVFF